MRSYLAFIHKDPGSDSTVTFPDFSGCITAGATLDEARDMAREALPFYIEGMLVDEDQIPDPMNLEQALAADPMGRDAVAFVVISMSGDTENKVLYMLLSAEDEGILRSVAEEVFDHPVRMDLAIEFLHDPRHHIAVALDGEVVVGMASAVHYVHPDKPAQLFINEVAVAPSHRRRGIASQLIARLLAHGRALGCTEAWVAADEDNGPARALYTQMGGQEESTKAVIYTFPLLD